MSDAIPLDYNNDTKLPRLSTHCAEDVGQTGGTPDVQIFRLTTHVWLLQSSMSILLRYVNARCSACYCLLQKFLFQQAAHLCFRTIEQFTGIAAEIKSL